MEAVTGGDNFLLSNGFDLLLDKMLEQQKDKWLRSAEERSTFEEALIKFDQPSMNLRRTKS